MFAGSNLSYSAMIMDLTGSSDQMCTAASGQIAKYHFVSAPCQGRILFSARWDLTGDTLLRLFIDLNFPVTHLTWQFLSCGLHSIWYKAFSPPLIHPENSNLKSSTQQLADVLIILFSNTLDSYSLLLQKKTFFTPKINYFCRFDYLNPLALSAIMIGYSKPLF